jgi:3-hydroxyisobutyrate dehydrogenase
MRIAMLGLGAMGQRMARRLLEARYHVVVWNRSAPPAEELRAHGATLARLPREAAEQAEVVLSMLTDDEASRAVWTAPPRVLSAGCAPGASPWSAAWHLVEDFRYALPGGEPHSGAAGR